MYLITDLMAVDRDTIEVCKMLNFLYFFLFQNVLIREEKDGSYTAIVADFGLSAKIPDPL